MAGKAQEFHLRFTADGDFAELQGDIKKLESSLDKIDIGNSNLKNSLRKVLNSLNNELDNFATKASQELNTIGDITALQKSEKKITDLITNLNLKLEQIDQNKIKAIFTGDALNQLNKLQQDLNKAESKFNELRNSVDTVTASIKNMSFTGEIKAGINDIIKLAKEGKDTSKVFDELKKKIKSSDYVSNNKEVQAQNKEVQSLNTQYEQLKKNISLLEGTAKAFEGPAEQYRQWQSELDNLIKKQAELREEYKKAHDGNEKGYTVDTAITDADGNTGLSLSNDIKQARNELALLEDSFNRFNKATGELTKARTEFNVIETALKDAREEFQKLNDIAKNLELSELEEAEQKIQQLEQQSKQAAKAVERCAKEVNDFNAQGVKKAQKNFKELNDTANKVPASLNKVSDGVNNVAEEAFRIQSVGDEIEDVYQRALQFFSLENAVDLFRNAVRQAFEAVKELDAAMTEIAVVTEFDVGDVWETLPEYTDLANKMGASIAGVYEVAKLYYQQGLDQQEVMKASEATLQMARVGNIDYAKSTDYMTAAIQGFKLEMEDATRVNDVFSKLAAITAADTVEIAEALTRTASIANSAGMELETTSAFLTQMIETTRESPENLGTALKTIIARFQEMKTAPGDVEVDGETVNVNKVEAALRTVGVALRDANGQFRDLDDVFIELSSKWQGLDKNTQRYIATIAAGSRQQSRFIAMMDNYDRTIELVGAAYNSAGAGQEQYEKTMDSLESKLNKLKNAWDEFTTGITNSDLIKGGIDLLTKILTLVNDLTGGFGDVGNALAKIGIAARTLTLGSNLLKKLIGGINLKGGKDLFKLDLGDFLKISIGKSTTEQIKREAGESIISILGDIFRIDIADQGLGKTLKNTTQALFGFTEGSRKAAVAAMGLKDGALTANAGIAKLATSLVSTPWGWIAAAILAVVAVLAAIGVAAHQESLEYKLEQAEKATEAAKDAANEAKNSYEGLLSGLNEYDGLKDNLNDLVAGTDAWTAALENTNAKVLELLSNYKELAQYISVGENGELIISDEGKQAIVDSEKEKVYKTTQALVGSEIAEDYYKTQKDIKELGKQTKKEYKINLDTALALYNLSNKIDNFTINSLEDWNKLNSEEKNAITEITGLSWDLIKGQIESGRLLELPIADYADSFASVQEYNNLLKQQETTYKGYISTLISSNEELIKFSEKFGSAAAQNLFSSSNNFNKNLEEKLEEVQYSGWEEIGGAANLTYEWLLGPFYKSPREKNRDVFGKYVEDYFGSTDNFKQDPWAFFAPRGYTKKEARELYKQVFNGQEADKNLSAEEIMTIIAEYDYTKQFEENRENVAIQLNNLIGKQAENMATFLSEDVGQMTAEELSNFISSMPNLFQGIDLETLGINSADYSTPDELEAALLEIFGKDEKSLEEVAQKITKNYIQNKKAAYTQLANTFADNIGPDMAIDKTELETFLQSIPADYVESVRDAVSQVSNILGKEGVQAYYNNMKSMLITGNDQMIREANNFINGIDWSNPIDQAYRLKQGLQDVRPEIRELSKDLLAAGGDIYSASEQFKYFYESEGFQQLTEDVEDFIKQNGKITDKKIKELAKSCKDLDKILKQNIISANALAKAINGLFTGMVKLSGITDAVLDSLSSMDLIEDNLSALEEFIDGFDPGHDSTLGIEFFMEAAEKLKEFMESGEYGNPQIVSYLEAAFGPDAFVGVETGEQWVTRVEELTKRLDIMTAGDSYGYWKELADKGGIAGLKVWWDEAGNMMADIGDNTYSDLVDLIAKTENISKELASSIVAGGMTYNPQMMLDLKENGYQQGIKQMIDAEHSFRDLNESWIITEAELEVLAYTSGKTVEQVRADILGLNSDLAGKIKFVDWFDSEGVEKTGKELLDTLSQATGGQFNLISDESTQDSLNKLNLISEAIPKQEDGATYAIDFENFQNFLKELKLTESQIQEVNSLVAEKATFSMEVDFINAEGKLDKKTVYGDTIGELEAQANQLKDQFKNANLGQEIASSIVDGFLAAFSDLTLTINGNPIEIKIDDSNVTKARENLAAMQAQAAQDITGHIGIKVDENAYNAYAEAVKKGANQTPLSKEDWTKQQIELKANLKIDNAAEAGAAAGEEAAAAANTALSESKLEIDSTEKEDSEKKTIQLEVTDNGSVDKINENIVALENNNPIDLEVTDNKTVEEINSDIIALEDNNPIELEVTDNGTVADIHQQILNLPDSHTVAVSATGIDGIASAINSLPSSHTVTINEVQGTTVSRSGGGASPNSRLTFAEGTPDMPAAASGAPAKQATKSSTKTLVGEEGVELAQNGHEAYLLGQDGPEIADIPAGTRIWNHEDTKKILRTGGTSATSFPAFAPGGFTWGDDDKKDYNDTVNHWGGSSGGSSGGGGVSADGDIGDAYESALDYYWNFLIKLKKLNADLEDLLNERDRLLSKEAEALAAGDLDAVAKAQEELAKKNEEVLKQHQKVVDEQAYYISSLNGGMQKLEGMMSKYGNVVSKVDGVLKVNWESYNALGDEAKEKMDGLIEEWEDYYDRLEESKDAIQEIIDYYRDLAEEYREMHREARETFSDLIDQLKDVMIQLREDEIKATEEYYDQLIEQDEDYLDALRDNVNERRRLRDMGNSYQELSEKQRRVSLLRRDTSGVYTNEIMTLEEEIAAMQQDLADQETDNILDKMDADLQAKQEYFAKSIELMEDSLEQQIKNGEIAMRAEEMLSTAPEEAYRILTEANAEYLEMSTTQQAIFVEDLKNQMIEMNRYQTEYYLKFAEQMDAIADVILNQLIDAINSVSINNNYNYTYVGSSSSGGGSSGSGGGGSPSTSPTGPSSGNEHTKEEYIEAHNAVAGGSTDSKYDWVKSANSTNYGFTQDYTDKMNKQAALTESQRQQIAGLQQHGNKSYADAYKMVTGKTYATGGYVKYTGPAWVDGTRSKPEAFLSAADTRNFETLKSVLNQVLTRKTASSAIQYRKNEQSDKLTTKVLNSITELKDTIKYLVKPTSSSSLIASNSNLKNGRGDCTIYITVDQIASDYDVDRAVEQVQRKILSSSSYRNINLINRTR